MHQVIRKRSEVVEGWKNNAIVCNVTKTEQRKCYYPNLIIQYFKCYHQSIYQNDNKDHPGQQELYSITDSVITFYLNQFTAEWIKQSIYSRTNIPPTIWCENSPSNHHAERDDRRIERDTREWTTCQASLEPQLLLRIKLSSSYDNN